MWGPIMLKQLVTLLHLRLLNLVTSGGFATAFLTRWSLPLLFLMAQRSWQHLLTKLNLLMMVQNSFQIFNVVLNKDLALRISLPKWFFVQSMILMHPKPLTLTEFQSLSLRCVLQSFINQAFSLVQHLNRIPSLGEG